MNKKLKSRRGTSIAEMLVAVIVLALLTAGGITATSAVMASYIRMKEAAHAEILASTVFEALSNEIRLGRDIGVASDPAGGDKNCLTLTSAYFGEGAELKLEDGRLVAQKAGASDLKQVLSDSAYNGLHLDELKFEEVPSGAPAGSGSGTPGRTVYAISFTVCNSSNSELWKGSASTAPMLEPPL